MKKRTMVSSIKSAMRRKWVSPMSALLDHGCMSLSQRCGQMRREGLNVVSRWKESNGKRFKEYRIA